MSTSVELQDPLVKQLIHHFFKGNLNFRLKQDDIEKMDWDRQQAFLDATVNSTLLQKYPVSSQFSKLFLKKIVEYLEHHQEVHDDLYAQLCLAMKVSNQNEFCFKHYVIGECLDNIITMKETRNMVVNGTTGLKTWQAALMLSDWALCNKDLFKKKNVLELGSGVGFAGAAILDWNNIDHLREDMIPDIVIGADIVYDPSILEPLCKVIQAFCYKNKHLEVYIASAIRNEDTFNGFLKTLCSVNLNYETVVMQKSEFIEWDENIQKCLLKIKL